MGFDFVIQYKGGKENIAADALSRREETRREGQILAISCPIPNWTEAVREEINSQPETIEKVQQVRNGEALGPWEYQDGILFFKGRIYLSKNSALIFDIIEQFHNSTHEGFFKTLQRIRSTFYSPNLKKISMDFIGGLPNSSGKTTVFVVVDRLSKYAHFTPISHPYTAVTVAQIFFDNIFNLHGMPLSIYCYNTSVHSTTGKAPFEVVYRRPPPTLFSYVWGTAKVAAVEQKLVDRDAVIQELRKKIQQAQNRMKQIYDSKHREREFAQRSLALRKSFKLAAKYYGPFKVLQKIGAVVYKLELPLGAKIHPVFHVSLLKKQLPYLDENGILQPEAILDSRVRRRKQEVLIQWHGLSLAEATWEELSKI
ncbi:hypothetical protein K2173_004975 [Erythroxylum novogranatense]|uniref:Chromo domain-containing protein n=1 Tax=Erythroxylum novogranatense TaxID=1862640 RepID=A0AAV8UCA6_9ROSI|nr:hypothetical protein K2173_004975 [Erythroxylum novogranatense]